MSRLAGVAVPEASVNEDDLLLLDEHKIWATRKGETMQAKPIAESVHERPHDHLWLRVLAFDCAHHARSFFDGKNVSHIVARV